ncbi:hypothetical protein J4G08_18150 [Candidatus Poribacteria bacterium]|nr:hypothetical protein [Candidatus Poribacteria bacterium]
MRVWHAAGVNLRKHLCFYDPFSIFMMIETVAHLVPTNATGAFGVDLRVSRSLYPTDIYIHSNYQAYVKNNRNESGESDYEFKDAS